MFWNKKEKVKRELSLDINKYGSGHTLDTLITDLSYMRNKHGNLPVLVEYFDGTSNVRSAMDVFLTDNNKIVISNWIY